MVTLNGCPTAEPNVNKLCSLLYSWWTGQRLTPVGIGVVSGFRWSAGGLDQFLQDPFPHQYPCRKLAILAVRKCFQLFVLKQYGLMQIIMHEEALTILARSVDSRDPASMLETVRLLAAICLVPPDGWTKFLNSFSIKLTENKSRF